MKRFSKYMSFKTEILVNPLLPIYKQSAISEDDHPLKIVGHARDHWWTLDFANAFVSPGVISRGEWVHSQGASRRRLGDHDVIVDKEDFLLGVEGVVRWGF
jgi:hypothetical protein